MSLYIKLAIALITYAFFTNTLFANEIWRGLEVKAESRCSNYDKKKQYPYPASIEHSIVDSLGGKIYGPYSGRYFESIKQTDIEHIVAASEGHDSGLCAASTEKRIAFAQDPLNLTLASPKVNRCYSGGKCGFDAGEWLPKKNQCWFVNRVVNVKKKYGLSVDLKEREALEEVLEKCTNNEIIFYKNESSITDEKTTVKIKVEDNKTALDQYDDNHNGRISCKEAKRHEIAPVTKKHNAYMYMIDRDKDGVVCN